MCGRYSLYSTEKVKKRFGIDVVPNYNISPGHKVIIIDDQVLIKKITWGINFPWLKDKIHINARLESINTGSFYSNYKRCIFITDGYFEWKKNKDYKTPYFHYLKESFIYMAGLYNDNGAIIITIPSSSKLNDIHHRQPLIIKDNHLTTWIQKRKIVAINSDNIHFHKISNKINNSKNNEKNLLKKIN